MVACTFKQILLALSELFKDINCVSLQTISDMLLWSIVSRLIEINISLFLTEYQFVGTNSGLNFLCVSLWLFIALATISRGGA